MTATRLLLYLPVILLPALLGCFRPYVYQPVTFHIRDLETGEPIEGIDVCSTYMSMLDFGLLMPSWGPREGKTDSKGEVTLMIDIRKSELRVRATAEGYQDDVWGLSGRAVRAKLTSRDSSGWHRDFEGTMCRNLDARLSVVVPDGYRGPVMLSFVPRETQQDSAGKRQFNCGIGPNGQVVVRESGHLVWTTEKVYAKFPESSEMSTVTSPTATRVPANEIALRYICRDPETHTWIYELGTAEEAKRREDILWEKDGKFNQAEFRRLCHIP